MSQSRWVRFREALLSALRCTFVGAVQYRGGEHPEWRGVHRCLRTRWHPGDHEPMSHAEYVR